MNRFEHDLRSLYEKMHDQSNIRDLLDNTRQLREEARRNGASDSPFLLPYATRPPYLGERWKKTDEFMPAAYVPA